MVPPRIQFWRSSLSLPHQMGASNIEKKFLGDQNRSTGSIFGFWETNARPAICYNAPMK